MNNCSSSQRSASDDAISTVSDPTGLLHPPRRIRNDSSSCFLRSSIRALPGYILIVLIGVEPVGKKPSAHNAL